MFIIQVKESTLWMIWYPLHLQRDKLLNWWGFYLIKIHNQNKPLINGILQFLIASASPLFPYLINKEGCKEIRVIQVSIVRSSRKIIEAKSLRGIKKYLHIDSGTSTSKNKGIALTTNTLFCIVIVSWSLGNCFWIVFDVNDLSMEVLKSWFN